MADLFGILAGMSALLAVLLVFDIVTSVVAHRRRVREPDDDAPGIG